MPNLMRTGGGGGGKIEITVSAGLSKSSSRNLPSLSDNGRGMTALALGTKAIFAGGEYVRNTVDIIDVVLSTGQVIGNLPNRYKGLGGGIAGDEAVFGGGYKSTGGTNSMDVNAINVYTGTKRSLTSLTNPHDEAPYGSAKNIVALIGDKTNFNRIDYINPATNTIQTETLSGYPGKYGRAVSFEEEILVGGGTSGTTYFSNVWAVNPVTRTVRSLSGLSEARSYLSACIVGDEAIYGGGEFKGGSSDVVDAVNIKTNTRRVLPSLSSKRTTSGTARGQNCAATSGSEGLFPGTEKKVDAVNPATNTTRTLETLLQVGIFPAGLSVNNEALFTDNTAVEIYSSIPPNAFYINPLELTNGAILDSLVSVDTDCTYKNTNYVKNSVLPYDPNVTSAVARNVPAGATSVNIHHVLKKGKYTV